MSRPRVSILTPSFNQAEWLAENLRSVALQTYADIEHVVMDGGSTDGSVELLEEAEGITWRSEPDNGQADAINKAFALSTGDIIGWINSDDAYVDGRVVADIVAFFEKHPGVDVAYGHCLQTAADGAVIQVLWAPRFDARLLGIVDFISQPVLDESFHFTLDYELWLRLASRGAVFARIPRILAVDRHQPERKSLTMLDIHAADSKRLSAMYGAAPAPTRFYLRQRVCGALLIPSIPAQLALSAPTDPLAGLWRRQLFSRKSTWPEEYR
jgi:hypothetical protein